MLLRIILLVLVAAPAIILLPRWIVIQTAKTHTYEVGSVPAAGTAVVFGAGLWRDGSPTPVLRDRVATAADLFFAGKAQRLLMSGGRDGPSYDEPGAMRLYAISLGVPEQAILLDYAGHRSYDTCYRARHIFGLQDAVLVTQRFHLPRTLFLCRALGLNAAGVEADRRIYRRSSSTFWALRELPATLAAIWDVYIARPTPDLTYGEQSSSLEAK